MWPRPTTSTRSFVGKDLSIENLVGKSGISCCQKEDDGAVKNLANRFGCVKQGKNAVQHGQDQGPNNGPRIAAATAEDRGPADDHRGHRRQEIDIGQAEIRGVGTTNNHQSGGGGQQAAGDVIDHQYLPDANACQITGLAVIPDGVEQPAISRAAQYEDDNDGDW